MKNVNSFVTKIKKENWKIVLSVVSEAMSCVLTECVYCVNNVMKKNIAIG